MRRHELLAGRVDDLWNIPVAGGTFRNILGAALANPVDVSGYDALVILHAPTQMNQRLQVRWIVQSPAVGGINSGVVGSDGKRRTTVVDETYETVGGSQEYSWVLPIKAPFVQIRIVGSTTGDAVASWRIWGIPHGARVPTEHDYLTQKILFPSPTSLFWGAITPSGAAIAAGTDAVIDLPNYTGWALASGWISVTTAGVQAVLQNHRTVGSTVTNIIDHVIRASTRATESYAHLVYLPPGRNSLRIINTGAATANFGLSVVAVPPGR